MSDGSKAPAPQNQLPAEPFKKRLGLQCLRCDGMELVDCDLCEDGHEGCPRCDGLGLVVCPACDAPPDAPLPAAPILPGLHLLVGSAKRPSAKQVAPASGPLPPGYSSSKTQLPLHLLRPPPMRLGSAGCGERLRWARKWRRLTLDQLAKTAGYCPRSLGSYERGQILAGPSLKTIEDLAQALGVRRSWLAFGLGSVEPTHRPHSSRASADNVTETL